MEHEIHTYTADMTRPLCPTCGRRVNQTFDDPELPWKGTCGDNHQHYYQLDTEEEFD